VEISNKLLKKYFILWNILSKKRKRQYFYILVLSMIMALTEIITIGAVIPFLGFIFEPEKFMGFPIFSKIINSVWFITENNITLVASIFFGLCALTSACIKLITIFCNARYSYVLGSELTALMLSNILLKKYESLVDTNSSDYLNLLTRKSGYLSGNIIFGSIQIISSSIIFLSVMFALLLIDTKATLVSGISIIGIYISLLKLFQPANNRISISIADKSTLVIKNLREIFGNLIEVKIRNDIEKKSTQHRELDFVVRKAEAMGVFVAQAPRFLVEGLVILLIAISGGMLSTTHNGSFDSMYKLVAIVLAAQRLLPVAQQIYNATTNIKQHAVSFHETLEVLVAKPVGLESSQKSINFLKSIRFMDVSYIHNNSEHKTCNNLNFLINKKDNIGIIGETGSGKSTLIELICGLRSPSFGDVVIDDILLDESYLSAWFDLIAVVPQNVFILDETIIKNITLTDDLNNIDWDLVNKIITICNLKKKIDSLEDGFYTYLGENGASFSGGQNQRIGLARALYRNPSLLILDEATSALDRKTEKEVINNLSRAFPDLTCIMVTHRLETLFNCNKIIELDNGKIKNIHNSIKNVGKVL
jgi:ATP-binding cassette, subfamily B, bacterial PglK